MGAVLDAHFEGRKLWVGLEEVNPIGEGFMGVGLADKDEVQAVEQGATAGGLMGLEVVTQQSGLERGIGFF